MKYAYPVLFTKIPEGYQITVPDLPGCITYGVDIPDALEMAQDAIEMWLWDAENNKEPIPAPSNQQDLSAPNSFVSMVCADTDRYRRENDTRSIKKTLSIPLWLNTKAEKANAPFSQILQEGLKKYLEANEIRLK